MSLPEGSAQVVVDLLDLDDLLERRADEIAECLPRFLAENAQAGREGAGAVEPGIAWKAGEDFGDGQIEPEIAGNLHLR